MDDLNRDWSTRRIGVEHPIWLRNLREIHSLTLAWLGALESGRASHLLARGMASQPPSNEDVMASLWMLEALDSSDPDDAVIHRLLDDLSVDDSLARLDRAVWTAQAWTMAKVLERAPTRDQSAVLNQLEQETWKRGQDCASRRWPELRPGLREDIRTLLLAARETPWAGRPGRALHLIVRQQPSVAEVELLACPHRSPWPEIAADPKIADRLCGLHEHWMRGFGYQLNHKLLIERIPSSGIGRCRQRWRWAVST